MFSIKFLISNFNSGIRNRCSYIRVKKTVLIIRILKILLRDGFIVNYNVMDNFIVVYLKYLNSNKSIVNQIVSGSRSRISSSYKDILYNFKGRYIIISTNKGLLTREEALKKKIGGFVILWIF